MLPNWTAKTRVSLVTVLVLVLTTLFGPNHHALAAGPRVLTLSDMSDESGAEGANNNAIAGATYKYATLLAWNNAYVTLFTHKFPGYAAFTVAVGVEDGSVDAHAGTASVSVTVDGKLVKTITRAYGQAAATLTVPFGQASQIKLTVHENQKNALYVLLGNPTVLTSVPRAAGTGPAPAPGGGTTTLHLFSASVAAGGQETALITTVANASLTLVINYPDGSQTVLGPKKAGPDGHFAYSWVVPGAMAGVTRVVVVSSGVAEAAFTIQ